MDTLLIAIVIHLVCDWLLQNEWMAVNKTDVRHLAAWVHSGIHFAGMLLIFSFPASLIVALIHLIIDTRTPLVWWRKAFRQTTKGEYVIHVAIWTDQVAHIAIITAVYLLTNL